MHGLYSAVYLLFVRKKKSASNILLGWLLILFGYRVGKSIALNFMEDLEFLFIFSGLAAMLAIGPLLLGYFYSMTEAKFKVGTKHILHAIPFVIVLCMSPFMTEQWFEAHGVYWALILLISFYIQFAVYIVLSWLQVKKLTKSYPETNRTQSQDIIIQWLKEIVAGISIIWFAYVLNILDEVVPYIFGPILYSISVYYLTVRAVQLKVFDLEASIFQAHRNGHTEFQKLVKLMEGENLYKQQDLSLSKVGNLIGLNNHDTSGLINEHARKNFNDFVNQYRVKYAQELLADAANDKFTISSIAFDCGFNTLSSFNSAFKKFAGMTPSAYRNRKP